MKEKQPFIVGDNYRKNPLSLIEGGYNVTVYYANPKKAPRIYTNVKKPDLFVAKFDGSILRYEVTPMFVAHQAEAPVSTDSRHVEQSSYVPENEFLRNLMNSGQASFS